MPKVEDYPAGEELVGNLRASRGLRWAWPVEAGGELGSTRSTFLSHAIPKILLVNGSSGLIGSKM